MQLSQHDRNLLRSKAAAMAIKYNQPLATVYRKVLRHHRREMRRELEIQQIFHEYSSRSYKGIPATGRL